ncbi:MAG: serine hydrolase domain-containing protein, partial [Planctomycetota bacterium]
MILSLLSVAVLHPLAPTALSTQELAAPTEEKRDDAVEDPRALATGTSFADDLVTGESHDFLLDVGEEFFIAGSVDQRTVDVVVRVYGPDEVLIDEFDGPGEGPEPFTFESEEAGTYRVEVSPFEEEVGEYTISLQVLQPIAKTGPGRVDQLMATYSIPGTPGGVVSVVRNGEVLFEKAYGMANLVHDIPFRVETPSNLGSTSKQFTAFAICMLEAQGELSLDDDVRKYLRKLPNLGEKVTLRHLLTHTSGYREFLNTFGLAGRRLDKGDYIGREEILPMVQRQP